LTNEEGTISKPCSLATVYQLAYDAGWLGASQKPAKKKMGF